MHITSAPLSTWEYIDDTCAWSSATRSGESDSVVVRTPPGMSSTLRLSSVCRMNMFMYLLMSMPSAPPNPGRAWLIGMSTSLRFYYPRPSRLAPLPSAASAARLVRLAMSDHLSLGCRSHHQSDSKHAHSHVPQC